MSTKVILGADTRSRYEAGDVDWTPPKDYRLSILVTREEGGGYSAVVTNLPGAGSCGDTEDEAVENAKAATRTLIESYRDAGDDIPWRDATLDEVPADGKLFRVILNA